MTDVVDGTPARIQKTGPQVMTPREIVSELDRYTTTLRSITQGRANFSTMFSDYSPVPYEIQQKLMENYHRQVEEVHS